jgi:hypothetical protein
MNIRCERDTNSGSVLLIPKVFFFKKYVIQIFEKLVTGENKSEQYRGCG